MINSHKVIEARTKICHSCPFCIDNSLCKRIREITRGTGAIDHALGIPRMKTTCPELKWYGITSLHAWYMKKYVLPNIDIDHPKLYRRIRHSGVTWTQTRFLAHRLSKTKEEARSIRPHITALRQIPNDYRHVIEINPPYLSDADCTFSFQELRQDDSIS